MQITNLPVKDLKPAPWNANQMDEVMLDKLKVSIKRYGVVQPLVVRPSGGGGYEILGGNQRAMAIRELGIRSVDCVVVDMDDAHARVLAEALNRIHGEDDLGLRAELLKDVITRVSREEVLDVLPETARSLTELTAMGTESVAAHLLKWEAARAARLRNLQFKLTEPHLKVVEKALGMLMPLAAREPGNNPNTRGAALALLCREYLDNKEKA